MNIGKFYERNKPIFLIGSFMALLFIGLIVFSRINPRKETELNEINDVDEEFYKVAYENLEDTQFNSSGSVEYENDTSPTTETQMEDEQQYLQEVDEKYGVLEINYTEDGFKPRVTRAALGQEVLWTNTTDRTMYLRQRKQTYPELTGLTEIMPGETFNFRMSVLGIWTYEENESSHFGSIEVREIENLPAPKNKVDNTIVSETNP